MEIAFFIAFSVLALAGAVGVLLLRKVLSVSFAFLLTLLGVAGIFALLGADFVALTQIIIYVGGILLLLLFALMFAEPSGDLSLPTPQASLGGGILAAFGLLSLLGVWLAKNSSLLEDKILKENFSTIQKIGILFLTDYLLVFELVGIFLTAVLVLVAWLAGKKASKD
ncbi:NADH-quinone oxidoreductase subunit J family protein [Hugenholtzia roseola]|uniref:NADH-quinone oxidoreductase subunit J family protein n=1 Tax=Hugenholtzia roseola TaxID=1002 RepID=UPI00040DADEA|nr:NADH-quinone oxidoreductase subunit J [Hugenholtzia roseola]